jgi:hypothetical protein
MVDCSFTGRSPVLRPDLCNVCGGFTKRKMALRFGIVFPIIVILFRRNIIADFQKPLSDEVIDFEDGIFRRAGFLADAPALIKSLALTPWA